MYWRRLRPIFVIQTNSKLLQSLTQHPAAFFNIISKSEQAVETARPKSYALNHDDGTIPFLKLPISETDKL